jgi:predicted TIM-barrel fold metal-dependent hydrolase
MAVANREGNDLVLKAVKAHPTRLAGMAVANPWFGKKAVEEIRRALGEGLTGVNIHSVLQGFRLADHLVDPILEAAAKHDVPVYAHTGTAGLAEPFHLIDLAMRSPTVNFLMGHAGASDYYNDAVRGLEFVQNVWMESSRNGPANYCHWQAEKVLDRVVFGSGAPEYIPEIELETFRDVFTDTADQERILGKTIQQVYKGRLPR